MNESNKDLHNNKFMSSVKVGSKGQIVIPKEVRNMFNINPGDNLVLLADKDKGIALNKLDFFSKLADSLFADSKNINNTDECNQTKSFVEGIKNIEKTHQED